MEKQEFKGNYISFKDRIIKYTLPVAVCSLVLISIVFFKSFQKDSEPKLHLIIILVILSVLGFLPVFFKSMNIVTEVIIDDDNISFHGYKFKQKWLKQFEINQVNVSIRSTGKRTNKDYYLKFKTSDGNYIVNGIQSWNYGTVVSLYRTFKSLKGEKIIFDDEYWLDVMEKKGKGMTTYEALMSKTSKNIT